LIRVKTPVLPGTACIIGGGPVAVAGGREAMERVAVALAV